jgi:hypothetical protein
MPNQDPLETTEAEKITDIDPQGDVMLALHTNDGSLVMKARCCSRILALSSSVFATVFSSQFREGTKLQEDECPTIDLKEDHPTAMIQTLTLLHFREQTTRDTDELVAIAVQADKFDCWLAVRDWTEQESAEYMLKDSLLEARQVGDLLVAASLLKFRQPCVILTYAVKALPPTFLAGHNRQIFKHVPEGVLRMDSPLSAIRVR